MYVEAREQKESTCAVCKYLFIYKHNLAKHNTNDRYINELTNLGLVSPCTLFYNTDNNYHLVITHLFKFTTLHHEIYFCDRYNTIT